jgi:hypothetical protein
MISGLPIIPPPAAVAAFPFAAAAFLVAAAGALV